MTLIETGSPFGPFEVGDSFGPVICESLEPDGGHIINDLDARAIVTLSVDEAEALIHQIAWDAVISGRSEYDQAVFGIMQGLLSGPIDREDLDPDTCLETHVISELEKDTIWELAERFGLPVKAVDKSGLPIIE